MLSFYFLLLILLQLIVVQTRYAPFTDLELENPEELDEEGALDEYDDEIHMLVSGGKKPEDQTDRELATHTVSIRTAHASLFFGDNHFCAGTFITMDTVVTAAHCVIDQNRITARPRRLSVVGGTVNRLKRIHSTFTYEVSMVIPHKKFMRRKEHDIALLVLKSTVNPSRLALLPLKPPEPGTICKVLGWGELYPRGPYVDVILFAEVTLLDREECVKYFPEGFADDLLCAASGPDENVDSCRGDSGGPMYCDGYLHGIIAWGFRCSGDKPGLFTSVYKNLEWIHEKAGSTQLKVVLILVLLPLLLAA